MMSSAGIRFCLAWVLGPGLVMPSGLIPDHVSAQAPSAEKALTQEDAFTWVPFSEALAVARASAKIIVLDVFTEYCGWCKKLDREVLSRPDVRAFLQEHFVPVKLDAEDRERSVRLGGRDLSYAEAMRAYGVDRYPTTLFLEPNGQLISTVYGYLPREEYLQLLSCFATREFDRGGCSP